jgi:hypothetical protein
MIIWFEIPDAPLPLKARQTLERYVQEHGLPAILNEETQEELNIYTEEHKKIGYERSHKNELLVGKVESS